jgi:hypothetical protein
MLKSTVAQPLWNAQAFCAGIRRYCLLRLLCLLLCCERGIDVKYFPLGRDWYNRLNALTLFPVPDIAYD